MKAAQMNEQRQSLIQELVLNEIELGHNTTEATKNICCTKDEGELVHSKVTKWFKRFHLGCKNHDD